MILGGYGFEILINDNTPLREYSEPYETSKGQITTKQSLIQNINSDQYYESDRTVFVAVPKPGMKFTVKLWADSAKGKAYRVRVYVDGMWDQESYTLTDAHSTIIEYYTDKRDMKKCDFVFNSSLWTDNESEVNVDDNIYGFGSITVEFFEAVWTQVKDENLSYNVIKDNVNGFNGSNDLSYRTQPEELALPDEDTPLIKRLERNRDVSITYQWKAADKPSAVLAVHYRPKAWLKLRGLASDPLYSRLSPGLPSESENSDDEYGEGNFIYESQGEIEKERERKKSRAHKHIDLDDEDSHRRKRRGLKKQITAEKFGHPKHTGHIHSKSSDGPRSSAWNYYKKLTTNKSSKPVGKCNGKKVDSSGKDNNVSKTPNVKFTRYFEEIIEETKFIDIEVGSKPTEEIRQNKKLREIIEILDSEEEV